MSYDKVGLFCDKIKSKLGAAECVPFASRLESIVALFEIIQLDRYDSVYVSALAPRDIIMAIIMCGATPVLCDVAPDSLTIDAKSLENAVRRNICDGDLYPRAVIADNFCGMPFAARAVKSVCMRFGLILIEDCGKDFGGTSDGAFCGNVGDYSLMSLGGSSAFGAGGNTCLLNAAEVGSVSEYLVSNACGSIFGEVDRIYGDALVDSAERFRNALDKAQNAAAEICKALANSDFWVQRGSGRQKSSFGSVAVIAQNEEQCYNAMVKFDDMDLLKYVRRIHVHGRSCFERRCRGFKDISNAAALGPRAVSVDIFGAVNNSDIDRLIEQFKRIVAAVE